MQVFYVPDCTGKQAVLSPEESRHCIQVLRFTLNDTIHLIDGRGGFYKAVITKPDPRACHVEVTDVQPEYHKRNCRLHLAVAPTKQMDRFEWFLEKAIEIGVEEITPLHCQRSERKEIKPERLEKLMIATLKQAMVAQKPRLNAMISFASFMKSLPAGYPCRYIAYCSEQANPLLQTSLKKGNAALIVIGPEGDFSLAEIEQALASGCAPVSLGNNRLRTETAALACCMIFSLINT